MANKSKTSPKNTKRPDYWSTFVPGDMSDAQKADCKVWEMWEIRSDEILTSLCEAGYKISVKLGGRGDGYTCIVAPADPDHQDSGWMLSGRGSTPLKAIKQACYRHFVLYDGVWPKYDVNAGPEQFDD